MPTIMSGCADNITTTLTELVVSCASGAGGQILVGTSTAHLFSTCDYVTVAGVAGTTEANGTWEITVVDSSHFLLQGSTFVHAYSGSGSVADHSLTPAFQVPSDGDDDTAESVLAAFQSLADRTQYLQKQTYATVARLALGRLLFLENQSVALQGTFQNIPNASGLIDVTGTAITIPNTLPGDHIFADASLAFIVGSSIKPEVRLTIIDGASTVDLQVWNSAQFELGATSALGGVCVIGRYTVVTGGTLTLKVRAQDNFATGNNYEIGGDVVTRYQLFR